MTEIDKLSKTVIGIAVENDVEINDDIKAIARAAQLRKEERWTYRAKAYIDNNFGLIMGFIGTTLAGIITAFLSGKL